MYYDPQTQQYADNIQNLSAELTATTTALTLQALTESAAIPGAIKNLEKFVYKYNWFRAKLDDMGIIPNEVSPERVKELKFAIIRNQAMLDRQLACEF